MRNEYKALKVSIGHCNINMVSPLKKKKRGGGGSAVETQLSKPRPHGNLTRVLVPLAVLRKWS